MAGRTCAGSGTKENTVRNMLIMQATNEELMTARVMVGVEVLTSPEDEVRRNAGSA